MRGKYKSTRDRKTYIHTAKCDECGEVKGCCRKSFVKNTVHYQCIRCGWRAYRRERGELR